MPLSLLDTDILSEVLKQRSLVVQQRAAAYLGAYGRFSFSVVSRFELLRGYKELGAAKQLARFQIFCTHSAIVPLSDAIFDRAADLWVFARQHGHPHGDADLLIAATALELQHTLVTGNTLHFQWIPGLTLEDWRQP